MFENLATISVLNFFDLKVDCHKLVKKTKLINKKYLLKSFSKLLNEQEFAKVYMAWDDEKLYFFFDIKHPYTKVSQEFRRSDSIEIFVDTRSLKTKGYITKFCHHFVFFASDVKGYKAMEVTRFRTDDMHKLCDPSHFRVESIIKPKSYMVDIEIPKHCLVGFNPLEINYFSFTYRINRYGWLPQNFSVSSQEHVIEKSPYLWAKINLKN